MPHQPSSRPQVDSGISPAPLRPAASPVDTFAPGAAGTKLAQLARGLATLAPAVGQFGAVLDERQRTEQTAAGKRAADQMASLGTTYAQLAREGKIPQNENPFFVAGFREQFGRVMADRWQGDLMLAAAKDPVVQDSTNLADFDAFARKQLQGWLDANVGADQRDQYFSRSFNTLARAYLKSVRDNVAASMASRLGGRADEALFAEVKGLVLKNGDAAETAKALTALGQTMVAQGRDGRSVNMTMARAIAAGAIELGDDGFAALDVMKAVQAGTGPLSNTTYGSELYQTAQDAIARAVQRANAVEAQTAAKAAADAENTVFREATQALVKDSRADLRPFAARLAVINPDAAQRLGSLQRTMQQLTVSTDPDVKVDLYRGIWTGETTTSSILDWMARGSLEAADAAWLMDQLDRKTSADSTLSNPLSDPTFRQTAQGLAGRFVDPTSGAITADRADRLDHARALLSDAWITYLSGKGATADTGEKIQWLTDKADTIVRTMRGDIVMATKEPEPAFPAITARLPQAVVVTQEEAEGYRDSEAVPPRLRAVFWRYGLMNRIQRSVFMQSQLKQLGLPLVTPPPTIKRGKVVSDINTPSAPIR